LSVSVQFKQGADLIPNVFVLLSTEEDIQKHFPTQVAIHLL